MSGYKHDECGQCGTEIGFSEQVTRYSKGVLCSNCDHLDDGFGNIIRIVCLDCGDAALHIVRPGKTQCGNCD